MAGKREQQMKEITERLGQGVKELFTSEMYTEYLKTMSQFHNYSFNNTLLIAMQKPDATLVAGYQAWQKKFKRQVKRGEKGIQIIAPAPIREKEEIEKIDPETNEPILRPDGQPETEEVVHTIPRFRVATVFDVSQTYGEPLPELETPELMGSVENYEIFMQALREIAPVPIRFDEIESGAKGYYSNTNKEIVIQSGMSESQTMKTGIHETTHAKLHDREIMEELGEKKNQMTREVEAESVAYTVCQYFGLDTSDYSFPYIAGWSSSVEMKELRTSVDTIRKTAGEMIDGMTEVMQRLIREQQEKQENAIGRANEQIYLSGQEERYAIYQIGEATKGRAYQFMGMDFVNSHDMKVEASDYEYVYGGRLSEGETLDSLYEKFNLHHPEGYEGHSLSVSDVVVLQREGTTKAYYVDSFGFTELPDFVRQRLHEVEMNQKRDDSLVMSDTSEIETEAIPNYPPVYQHTLDYAMEHAAADEYLDSRKLNIDCKRAVEDAIRNHFDGLRLAHDAAETVLEEYGQERLSFVLACSVQYQSSDGRISRDTKEWAESIVIPENISRGIDANLDYVVNGHPGVLDVFIGLARQRFVELEKIQEPEKEGISLTGEQANVLDNHDTELAYKIEPKKGYLFIQTSSEGGYDYTFYDENYREVDGGIYDNGDLSVGEVIDELISEQYGMTLPEPKVIDCEQFLDTVDRAEYFPQRSYEALKELMNSGADEIAFRVGYGYVSVQKVPEGYEYIDYDDKWQEIDGDIYDDPDASMEDVVSWIFKKQRFGDLDCAPLDYQEVVKETIQSAEERLSEDKLTPTSQISRKERALGGESRHDIEETVLCYAQAQLEDMGLAGEVRLNAARVYGSRTREGLYNNESDVDVVLSYTGNIREDDFFSALHGAGMEIAGLPLDINPISTERTGTIQEYLEQAEKYLDQKEVQNLTSDIVKFELDYESDRDMLEFWDGKAEVETEPSYQVYEVIGNAVERKDTEKFVAHLEQIIHEHEVEEPITGAAADLLGKITGKLVIVQPEPKISFYVAECMEFPVMGEYYDNLTLQEAVQKYEEIPADRINGIKGIGFRLEDGSIYDGEYELMSAGVILKDSINLVPHYKESPLVQQAIIDLEKILSGRQQEKISEQPQVSADKGAAEMVSETASELVKQPERTPEKDNSKSEGTGRKQSVLNALRERQAKLKQEQKSTEQKPQNHKKGEQEL